VHAGWQDKNLWGEATMRWVAPTEKDEASYYDDPHNAVGSFDSGLANPPFNVNGVDKARRKQRLLFVRTA